MKRLIAESEELNRVQANISDSVEPLEKSLIGKGLVLLLVKLKASQPYEVSHGLARAPVGYIPISKSGPAIVWDIPNTLPAKFLTLVSDTDVTLKLWVF